MPVVVCPGVHSPALTQSFLTELALSDEVIVYPTDSYPAYSAWHLIQFLEEALDETVRFNPVVFLGFSAGVVAAIATAYYWQWKGRFVKALIAMDGWGVPLRGSFPIHRISHDAFTHYSSSWAEPLRDCFYADPSVDHLDLWRSPTSIYGNWIIDPSTFGTPIHRTLTQQTLMPSGGTSVLSSQITRTTVTEFLHILFNRYR